MAHFIKIFNPDKLNATLVKQLHTIIENDTQDFQPSLLYSEADASKIFDLNRRKSVFKTINPQQNKVLFEIAHKIVNNINLQEDVYNFSLVENDVTHIKYQAGDFFQPHEDYLTLTSNMIEEFTLLICLKANCQGGRTIFHLNPHFQVKCEESINPYHGVVFRKDITHEGELLTSGYKEIATLNLRATKKESGQIIVLTIRENEEKFCYSRKELAKFPRLIKKLAKTKPWSKEYIQEREIDISLAQMKVLNKVLTGHHLTLEEAKSNYKFLQKWKISTENILVNVYSEEETSELSQLYLMDSGIQFLDSLEKYEFMIDKIKKEKLPYIPFMLYAQEGAYGVDGDIDTFPMEIFASFFGEYNQFSYFYNPLKQIDKKKKIGIYEVNDIDYEINETNEKYHRYLDFQVINTNEYPEINEFDMNCIINPHFQYGMETTPRKLNDVINSMLENSDYLLRQYFPYEPVESIVRIGYLPQISEDHTPFYSLHPKSNNLYLNHYQSIVLETYLKNLEFHNLVLQNIPKIKLNFPQHRDSGSGGLCNETAYYKISMINIFGYLDMSLIKQYPKFYTKIYPQADTIYYQSLQGQIEVISGSSIYPDLIIDNIKSYLTNF